MKITETSIKQIITDLTQDPAWEPYRAWQEILDAWPEALASLKLSNKSPAELSQQIYPRARTGDLLQVATANASLADHCNWQRRSLLKILNSHIAQPLVDIRFSSSRWRQAAPPTATLERLDQNQERCVCPQCGGCAPRWELERWSVCRFCIAPSWR
jgi:predicted nucleic acid-binding Zn ribbon protein